MLKGLNEKDKGRELKELERETFEESDATHSVNVKKLCLPAEYIS